MSGTRKKTTLIFDEDLEIDDIQEKVIAEENGKLVVSRRTQRMPETYKPMQIPYSTFSKLKRLSIETNISMVKLLTVFVDYAIKNLTIVDD